MSSLVMLHHVEEVYTYNNGLLKLNGSNHFVNNIAHGKREFQLVSMCNYDTTTVLYYAGGGAIAFAESTVIVDGYSSFEGNTAYSKSLAYTYSGMVEQ